MRIFLMTTEDWKEIYDGIKEAENFLKPFGVKYETKRIELDVTNPLFYHTSTSWSWLKQVQTKSFHGAAILSLGESYGGKGYDYYGLIVDKSKSLEDNSLFGQHESKFRTIEVYANRSKRKHYGLSYVGYNLVHETLHALANFYKVEDTLHQYLVDNKKLQGYMEQLQSKVNKLVIHNGIDAGLKGGTNIPKENMWKYKYFKPKEKTGSFGTVDMLKPELLDKLEQAREFAGIPFKITSGFRTPEHNKKVGGNPNSAHLKGLAVDIAITPKNFMVTLIGLHRAGFNRFGLAKTFIHADCDTSLPQNTVWFY